MTDNLFANLPAALPQELVETLLENQQLRIERIVSTSHATAEGYWYDQDESEWVIVLRGEAKLSFQDRTQPMVLKPGDFVNLPAHCKHRVDWTSEDEPTVWLAVFYRDNHE